MNLEMEKNMNIKNRIKNMSKRNKIIAGAVAAVVILGPFAGASETPAETPQTIAKTQTVTQTPKAISKPAVKPTARPNPAVRLIANEDEFMVVWKEWPVGFEKKINTAFKNKDCAALDKLQTYALNRRGEYAYQPTTPRGTRGMADYLRAKQEWDLGCSFQKVYRKKDKYGGSIWYWSYSGMTDAARDRAIAQSVAEAK